MKIHNTNSKRFNRFINGALNSGKLPTTIKINNNR